MDGGDGGDGTTPVVVGGLSRAEIVGALERAGVLLNDHARTLLASPAFDAPPTERVAVVLRSVAGLGLEDGAVLADVLTAASRRGLSTCPGATGPFLRLALPHQATAPDSVLSVGRAPSGSITVASDPLGRPGADDPRGFYLRTVDGVPWLRGYRCGDDHRWSPDDVFAFRAG